MKDKPSEIEKVSASMNIRNKGFSDVSKKINEFHQQNI